MGFSKSLLYRCVVGRAFSEVGRSLLGVKNCVLVPHVTNQLCGLGQNT